MESYERLWDRDVELGRAKLGQATETASFDAARGYHIDRP